MTENYACKKLCIYLHVFVIEKNKNWIFYACIYYWKKKIVFLLKKENR